MAVFNPERHWEKYLNLEAQHAFQTGSELLKTRTDAGVRASIVEFDKVLQVYPDHVKALTAKATAHNVLYNLYYDKDKKRLDTSERLYL